MLMGLWYIGVWQEGLFLCLRLCISGEVLFKSSISKSSGSEGSDQQPDYWIEVKVGLMQPCIRKTSVHSHRRRGVLHPMVCINSSAEAAASVIVKTSTSSTLQYAASTVAFLLLMWQ
jgi:hypothetical protein